MRIKFLSLIASFFMASCVITSCLDNDTVIEYSPDATIHAFALDTIGYGVNYKFTIDQIHDLIYNEDSLPVRADTIINRILIKTLSTASGIVTIGNDSILNINDSVDLSKYINAPQKNDYLVLKVWTQDFSSNKTYKLSVRVHLQDPDSLSWGNIKDFSEGKITGKQKAVILGEDIFVYSILNNELIAYKANTSDPEAWEPVTTEGADGIEDSNLSSIIAYNGNLYMVIDNQIYYSADGSRWERHTGLNQTNLQFTTLLAGIQPDPDNANIRTTGISAIASEDGVDKYFYMSDENATAWVKGEKVSDAFPVSNISSTIGFTKTHIPFMVSMGNVASAEAQAIVPWSSYDGLSWIDLSTNSSYCPMLNVPSIISYNEAFYAFGNDFNVFYTSPSGITWKEASKKFYFPEALKARTGANYSIVVDKQQFIWIILSKDGGDDEIWRGRLNKMGFDKQ